MSNTSPAKRLTNSGKPRAPLFFEPEGMEQRFHLLSLQGTEAVNELFRFDAIVRKAEKKGSVKDHAQKLIGRPVTFGFTTASDERLFHGIISHCVTNGNLEMYVTVVPWLWPLTHAVDSHIYLNRSIPDIVKLVFAEHGKTAFRFDIREADYAKLESCVRYQENVVQFVRRLLERAGIYTYWEHTEGKHILVLADGSVPPLPCTGSPFRLRQPQGDGEVRRGPEVFSWSLCRSLTPTSVTVDEYDHRTPRTNRQATEHSRQPSAGEDRLEIYWPAAGHRTRAEGERIARVRLEQEEAAQFVVSGAGNVPSLTPGRTVALDDSTTAGPFLITSVSHDISRRGRREGMGYANDFQCVPVEPTYRPPCVTPLPVIAGYQTAVVVDAKGNDVPGDNPVFTDKFGRVKLRFRWNRTHQGEINSSGWVRVAHAGGQQRCFRIGEEAVVVWEHGDPDRPLVIDSAYATPEDAPFRPAKRPLRHAIRQQFVSDPKKVNEVRLDAQAGHERLTLGAGLDAAVVVGRDLLEDVAGDSVSYVDGCFAEQIGGQRWTECQKSWLVKVLEALAVKVAQALLLESSKVVHIKAPEIVLEGSGGFIRIGASGVEIVGAPFTQINCGGSAPSPPHIDEGKRPSKKRNKKTK
jgi:type VI secretion system secreted protein VgrG